MNPGLRGESTRRWRARRAPDWRSRLQAHHDRNMAPGPDVSAAWRSLRDVADSDRSVIVVEQVTNGVAADGHVR